jgi:hypothetical protein
MRETKHKGLHVARFHLYKIFRIGKAVEMESRVVFARA